MNSSHQPNDTPDYERRFFTTLSSAWGCEKAPTADDFLKVTDGPQSRRFLGDNIAILITFTPEGAEAVHMACGHFRNHQCDGSVKMLHYLAGVIEDLLEEA